MSRPIYEPSLTRTDQALGWGTRQLARRPAPESAGTIPCFRAMQFEVNDTVPGNGDPTSLHFDVWENGDEAIFDPAVIPGSPDTIVFVDTLSEGIYLVNFSLEFVDNIITGNIGLCIDSSGSYTEEPVMIHPSQPLPGAGTTGRYRA